MAKKIKYLKNKITANVLQLTEGGFLAHTVDAAFC